MLESEERRQVLMAAIAGLMANPAAINAPADEIARRALAVTYEIERQAPAAGCGIG